MQMAGMNIQTRSIQLLCKTGCRTWPRHSPDWKPVWDLNDIIQVNMHSIYHKSEIAGRTATNALLWIYVVGIVCVVIALGILMVFPGSITRPIRELMDGIVEISNRNYDKRLHFKDTREFEEVDTSFNNMDAKLCE